MTYMQLLDEFSIANEWCKYKHFTVRPQDSMVNFYESFIETKKSDLSLLLYGGTPEVRSLCRKLNQNITIMDRSLKMIRSMGRVIDVTIPLSPNETVRVSDWLVKQTDWKESFNLLIGDDAINMIPWNQWRQFLDYTFSYLDSGGVFLCHLLLKPSDESIDQSLDAVIDEYQSGSIKSPYDFASRLNASCYDKHTYRMGWQHTINALGENRLAKLKSIFPFDGLFQYCNSEFYCPPRLEFESLIQEYFQIDHVFYANDFPFCEYEPIYVLIKKIRRCL